MKQLGAQTQETEKATETEVTGRVRIARMDGIIFKPDSSDRRTVFIPHFKSGGAFPNDEVTVLVSCINGKLRSRVKEIRKRHRSTIIGYFMRKDRGGTVLPINTKLQDITIPAAGVNGANNGQLVSVKLSDHASKDGKTYPD